MTTTTGDDVSDAVIRYTQSLYFGGRMLPSKIVETLQQHLKIEASTRLRVTAFGVDVLTLDVTGGQDVDGDRSPEVVVKLDAPGSALDVEATVEIPAAALKTGGDALFLAALAALQAKVPTTAALAKLVESMRAAVGQ